MTTKRQLFPPARDTQKREASVSLRFHADVYERLKRAADFSDTTVANLLHYVTMNTVLPILEREMQKAVAERDKAQLPKRSPPDVPVSAPTNVETT